MEEDLNELFTPDYGNWELNDAGEIVYHNNQIGYNGRVFSVSELKDIHLTHMLSKFRGGPSEDAANYYFVYLEALRRAGYKTLTIDLNAIHNITIE